LSLKNIFAVAVISALFTGCSGCSEDSDIPSGERTGSFDISETSKSTKSSDSSEDREEQEEYHKKVSQDAVEDMSDIYQQLQNKDNHSEESEDEYNDDDDYSDGDYKSDSQDREDDTTSDKSSSENDKEEEKASTPNSWGDLDAELKKQMEESIKKYPTPPRPANLTPYDDVDEDSVYESDGKASSSGTGNFPPMPPMMLLQK
jgi:hypothetical protein